MKRNVTRGFAAVSILAILVIGFALVSRVVALWPMYVSAEVRSQVKLVLEDAKMRHGLSVSYTVPTRARCQMGQCWLMLREPFNFAIDPAVRHVVYIQWPQNDPYAYELSAE